LSCLVHRRPLPCPRQPWVLHAHQIPLGSSPNHTVLGEVCSNIICNLPNCFQDCRLTPQTNTSLFSDIQHHIFSSLCSGLKNEFNIVNDNIIWLVGDGKNINFWFDHWNGDPLFESLNLSAAQVNSFPPKLCSYIHDSHWHILETLLQQFPY